MSSSTGDPVVDGASLLVEFLKSSGPAGIVALVMWMWMKREADRADRLQTKFEKAIDNSLNEGH